MAIIVSKNGHEAHKVERRAALSASFSRIALES